MERGYPVAVCETRISCKFLGCC